MSARRSVPARPAPRAIVARQVHRVAALPPQRKHRAWRNVIMGGVVLAAVFAAALYLPGLAGGQSSAP